jgi:hypothetical protein
VNSSVAIQGEHQTGPEDVVTPRPYLSAEQLAALTPWTLDAIEKLIKRGVLVRGVHYFQPLGRRTKLIFKWEAVTALIEGLPVPSTEPTVVDEARTQQPRLVSVRAKRTIDVEKATTDLQRMLG